jgi:hypothetical protein
MPTLNKDAKQALYAVAGVADLAVSTIRQLPQEAERFRSRFPDEAAKTYDQLIRRGESLVTGVRRSRSTRQAAEATRTKAATTRTRRSAKTTRTSAKAASTSVRRAAEADAKAARDAAAKVGDK